MLNVSDKESSIISFFSQRIFITIGENLFPVLCRYAQILSQFLC